jgi:hypothetical protein
VRISGGRSFTKGVCGFLLLISTQIKSREAGEKSCGDHEIFEREE